MIPQFDVSVEIDVDLSRIPSLPWDVIHETEGLMSNHEYVYISGVTWRLFERAFELEGKAIEYIDSHATTHREFEELANSLIEEEDWEELDSMVSSALPFLDLGIASTVFALYAFKCFPITSCRGHLEGRGENHPLVVFFPRPELAPTVVGVAAEAGAGMCYVETYPGGVMVYGRSIVDMRKFASGLHRASPMLRSKKNRIQARTMTKHYRTYNIRITVSQVIKSVRLTDHLRSLTTL